MRNDEVGTRSPVRIGLGVNTSRVALVALTLVAACAAAPEVPRTPTRPPRIALPPMEQPVPFVLAATSGDHFPAHWIDGTVATEVPLQVHWYDADTVILRQSKRLHYEAPFVYLVFGNERALLLDTGAPGDVPLRSAVDQLVAEREQTLGHELELVVAHTHGHSDHVAHDRDFARRPRTRVVPDDPQRIMAQFGLASWPDAVGSIDLGGRVLDVLPTPGHHPTHLCFHDARSHVVFSGDTFYPGFLFILDPDKFEDFRSSMRRLLDFSRARGATTFLGGHVEMSATAGVAYPYRTIEQPDETALALGLAELEELVVGLESATEAREIVFDRVIVYPAYIKKP